MSGMILRIVCNTVLQKKSACDVIVTRNARDFAMSDMPVMTPDDAIDMIG